MVLMFHIQHELPAVLIIALHRNVDPVQLYIQKIQCKESVQ